MKVGGQTGVELKLEMLLVSCRNSGGGMKFRKGGGREGREGGGEEERERERGRKKRRGRKEQMNTNELQRSESSSPESQGT